MALNPGDMSGNGRGKTKESGSEARSEYRGNREGLAGNRSSLDRSERVVCRKRQKRDARADGLERWRWRIIFIWPPGQLPSEEHEPPMMLALWAGCPVCVAEIRIFRASTWRMGVGEPVAAEA